VDAARSLFRIEEEEMDCWRRERSAAKYAVAANSVFCSRRISSMALRTTATYTLR